MIGREIISAVSQLNEFDIISQRFCRKSKKLGVSWHGCHLKKSWSKLHWIALWLVVASIACVQLNVCSVLKREKQKQCRHCIWECSNSLGICEPELCFAAAGSLGRDQSTCRQKLSHLFWSHTWAINHCPAQKCLWANVGLIMIFVKYQEYHPGVFITFSPAK